jgi:hypothetical protein
MDFCAVQGWGGEAGSVRYPPFINNKRSWPVEEPAGKVITQDHDEQMLAESIAECPAKADAAVDSTSSAGRSGRLGAGVRLKTDGHTARQVGPRIHCRASRSHLLPASHVQAPPLHGMHCRMTTEEDDDAKRLKLVQAEIRRLMKRDQEARSTEVDKIMLSATVKLMRLLEARIWKRKCW